MTSEHRQCFSGQVARSCRSQWVTETNQVEGAVIPVLCRLGTAHDFHVSRQDPLDLFPPHGRISLPPFTFFFFF